MNNDQMQSRNTAALTVLRLGLGVVFTAHGAQKLFVYGIAGVSDAFSKIGLPAFLGPVVGAAELLGGIALVAGFLTPLAAAGLAVVMVGAILKVHLAGGFFNPTGIEFPLTLLAGLVALAIAGAGRFSLDGVIAGRRSR